MPTAWSNASLRQALESPDSFTTTLISILIDQYGTEFLKWDPATIAMEIEQDFNIDIKQVVHDRIMVGVNLLTTDNFYNSLPDFITFCNILSGDTYDPSVWDPATLEEIAWGITEALLLEPPDGDEPFNAEIVGYIRAALDDAGIINPPDVLQIATGGRTIANAVDATFSDDPTLFNSIYDFETSKTNAITSQLRDNLKDLYLQLSQLQLRNGNAKDAIQRMSASLKEESTNI